ncbi:protoheme IX farnesyltransferase [Paenibacillus xerothermodurans]|uniref:Protoheme IX farnesyltransferase n=2 Tax=Paenibacillus xerothermodurans TaxID=1977292 RepID=A0A2W1NA44_PAEXE|nr:heme o synthase [Paenibacillus xerothermodurans]PZE21519.1 protoheme IX farnesyltransferase [Paenibacillus xerothermodurans]
MRLDLTVDAPVEASPDTVRQEPVTWRDFVQLAKPGIIFSNLITAFGGFWLASGWHIDWLQMLYTMVGTALVIASGCVLNNYLDRDMDTKMARTRERVLASGKIAPSIVLAYGIVLGLIGVSGLALLVNPVAAVLGLIGFFVYVWIYTAWFKRTSVWSTVVGSFSGAMPPMIGYCAVRPEIDHGALILFAILFLWQPPHFWALGIRRMEEYRAAGFPLLPVVKGSFTTKISMIRYVVLLVPVSLLLYVYEYVNVFYFYAATAMGLYWAFLCIKGFTAQDEQLWAKKTFIYSINYIMVLFIVMILTTKVSS